MNMTPHERKKKAWALYILTGEDKNKVNKLIVGETSYKKVVQLVKRHDVLQMREEKLKRIAYGN